jgi:hypothetical protein
MFKVWCKMPFVILFVLGALFGVALRTTFSIFKIVISKHSIS